MSSYLYPMRLQPQIIYPDVEPLFVEAPDNDERRFKALPVITELLMQQLASKKVSKPNPFSDLLPGDFEDRPYNDEDLDREIYKFKAEWDRILVREKVLSFVTPQLRDILAAEIEYAKENGYPLLDPVNKEVDQEALFRAARAMLRIYEGRGFRGLGEEGGTTEADLQAAANAAASFGSQSIPAGPLPTNDSFVNVMQQLSPYMEFAVKVVAEILTAFVSVASQVAGGVSIGTAIATSMSAAFTAIESLSYTFATTQVFSMVVMAAVKICLKIMECVSKWGMMRAQLRALCEAASKVRDAFNEITEKIVEATRESREKTDLALAEFRAVMGEMIARVQRGERILGFVNCNPDGTIWLAFGVDPRYVRDTGTQKSKQPSIFGSMTVTQKGLLVAAGAAILLSMGARR